MISSVKGLWNIMDQNYSNDKQIEKLEYEYLIEYVLERMQVVYIHIKHYYSYLILKNIKLLYDSLFNNFYTMKYNYCFRII